MLDKWLFGLAALSAVLVPAGFLARRLGVYGVNIPYRDQWEVANRQGCSSNTQSANVAQAGNTVQEGSPMQESYSTIYTDL
jgi:hypothetical protein